MSLSKPIDEKNNGYRLGDSHGEDRYSGVLSFRILNIVKGTSGSRKETHYGKMMGLQSVNDTH